MTIQLTRRRLLACSGALLLARAVPARASGPETGPPYAPASDAARAPQLSEAAMLARAIGPHVVLLDTSNNAVRDIMRRALDFGRVMAQTSNALAVMECTGVATRLEQEGGAPASDADSETQRRNVADGYMGGEIDLRFNFDAWRDAFAVTQRGDDGGVVRSLQFFDARGDAVHKLYLRSEAAGGLFDLLVLNFRAARQQRAEVAFSAAPQQPAARPDSAIDVRQFRQAWLAMADPGQFSALLEEFCVTRAQALRLAPPGMAQRLAPHALGALFEAIVRHQLLVMVLAGNAGVTQIYTGALAHAAAQGDVCTVQAPGFTLRVQDRAAVYVVQRAGATSVELAGANGDVLLTLVGLRDRAAQQAWAELVKSLPKE